MSDETKSLASPAPAAPSEAPREPATWGALPVIDPNPSAPMCGEVNGNIICCRSRGHDGRHATPFPSLRRHGPVWVYWGGPPLGPFGTCHVNDPATHLYCGLEAGHGGDHLAPTNERAGKTLAEWPASAAPPPPPEAPRAGRCCSCGYEGPDETPCSKRDDAIHCDHWWEGIEGENEPASPAPAGTTATADEKKQQPSEASAPGVPLPTKGDDAGGDAAEHASYEWAYMASVDILLAALEGLPERDADLPMPRTANRAAAAIQRLRAAPSPSAETAARCTGRCYCHAGADGLMHPPCCEDCAPRAAPEASAHAGARTIHELKTWPEPFDAILDGRKRFEVRRADRPFAVGDALNLREWGPAGVGYTGREIDVEVTYLVTPGSWGLPPDLCVMGIRRYVEAAAPSPSAPPAPGDEPTEADALEKALDALENSMTMARLPTDDRDADVLNAAANVVQAHRRLRALRARRQP